MPNVSVHYKVYLTAGHHRQPRNQNSELEPNPPSGGSNISGPYQPQYIPVLSYMQNGQNVLAQLIFWSVTDGTNGTTYPAQPLTVNVGGANLTITAWYLPIGFGNGGGPAIIDDAFSAAKGDFIDDTFVTVTSDPWLTSQANVVGIVPTSSAETLQAAHSVNSTSEPFSKWMSFGAGTANGNSDTLNVPAQSVGMAIALYQRSDVNFNPPRNFGEIYGTLIGGVAVDGGGQIVINGIPHPVDPWGPLVVQLVQAALTSAGSRGLTGRIGAEVRQLTARSVLQSIRTALPNIEKEAQGKEE